MAAASSSFSPSRCRNAGEGAGPLLRSGTEQRPVDAVGNHVKRIVLQKRPANQARQPAGRSHQRQPGHTGKNGALVRPVLVGGVHHPAGRDTPRAGGSHDTRSPTGDSLIIKKCAVSSEGPAVVQRPYHRDTRLLQPAEQLPDMQVIAVKVVQLDQIGPGPLPSAATGCGWFRPNRSRAGRSAGCAAHGNIPSGRNRWQRTGSRPEPLPGQRPGCPDDPGGAASGQCPQPGGLCFPIRPPR